MKLEGIAYTCLYVCVIARRARARAHARAHMHTYTRAQKHYPETEPVL
jgi:hypothetical protein